MFHSCVYQMVKKKPSFSVSTSWFQELPGEVQSKTKATDPSAKSRSLCRVSTQHGKAWWLAGSKMLMEHLWNIYGTSMEHLWHHRWNIYGLGLENWMTSRSSRSRKIVGSVESAAWWPGDVQRWIFLKGDHITTGKT